MSIYEYGNDDVGLHFTIDTVLNADGSTTFNVNVLTGYLNLNALYWKDADQTNEDVGGDGTANDLIGFSDTKSENSLNMNGDNVVWNEDGTFTTSKEVYDGGVNLADAGLGHGSDYFLDANGTSFLSFTIADLDLSAFQTLGVRATSTSTAGGSIKWVDDEPCVPHAGDALFVENFDGYPETQQYFDPPGTFVFGTTDLNAANDWTNASYIELGADGYGDIQATSGEAWLDTQNSPGEISISHEFTDTTDAVDGKTSVLSFDIGIQSLDYQGVHYATDPNASFEFRIDGQTVAQFDASDAMFVEENKLYHVEVDIGSYALAGDTHTLSLVDTTASQSNFTGFSVDSIKIDDWVMC
jgi:hypothetical protein